MTNLISLPEIGFCEEIKYMEGEYVLFVGTFSIVIFLCDENQKWHIETPEIFSTSNAKTCCVGVSRWEQPDLGFNG